MVETPAISFNNLVVTSTHLGLSAVQTLRYYSIMSAWDISENAFLDHTMVQIREHGSGIWILTMASPSTHNILSPLLMGALARAVDRLSSLSDQKVSVDFLSDIVHIIHLLQVRVIILEAAGKSFSAGIDINMIRDEPNLEAKMTRAIDPMYAVQESRVPVIGCVRGKLWCFLYYCNDRFHLTFSSYQALLLLEGLSLH